MSHSIFFAIYIFPFAAWQATISAGFVSKNIRMYQSMKKFRKVMAAVLVMGMLLTTSCGQQKNALCLGPEELPERITTMVEFYPSI